jgi:excisionase family DNA binding protein
MEVQVVTTEQIDRIEKKVSELQSLVEQVLGSKSQPESWLTKDETAKRLRVCKKTLDNLLSKRKLPYVKNNRRVVINSKDVDEFMRKHYIKARS